MPTYEVVAAITSAPINVWLTVAAHEITLERDDTGCWAGKAGLSLSSPAAIRFRAVGITSSPWTLTLKFTPETGGQPSGACKTYTHTDIIPDNELSDLTDQVTLA